MNKQDEEKAREISHDTMYIVDTGQYSYTRSIVENMCLQMASWKEQQMIEKACNWIKENKHKYIKLHSMKLMVDDSIIEDFKKYMEEN